MTTIQHLQSTTDFSDETFTALDARGLIFANKEFHDCSFSACQLAEAQFLHCKFIDCTMKGCDLSNAILKGSSFRGVKFAESKLLGINWTPAGALVHLEFRHCNLSFCNFSGVDLRQLVCADCVAREVDFGHANLTESDLRGTDFLGSRFLQTNLSKSDCRNATNYAIRPGDNILKKTRFSLPEATALLDGLDIILEP